MLVLGEVEYSLRLQIVVTIDFFIYVWSFILFIFLNIIYFILSLSKIETWLIILYI
jgi:hypothetical protein